MEKPTLKDAPLIADALGITRQREEELLRIAEIAAEAGSNMVSDMRTIIAAARDENEMVLIVFAFGQKVFQHNIISEVHANPNAMMKHAYLVMVGCTCDPCNAERLRQGKAIRLPKVPITDAPAGGVKHSDSDNTIDFPILKTRGEA